MRRQADWSIRPRLTSASSVFIPGFIVSRATPAKSGAIPEREERGVKCGKYIDWRGIVLRPVLVRVGDERWLAEACEFKSYNFQDHAPNFHFLPNRE